MRVFVVTFLAVSLVLALACNDQDPTPGDQGTGDSAVVDQGQSSDGGGPPVDASGKVPTLSKSVVANCFNWPVQEFTPANHANWISSLKVGQLAVELTLKDTTGKSHTLSQLLGSRPIWLQFGSYT